ncbi:redoxin domain-containing protein [Candidatus Palauibacter sp.]|uniref:redoxin domain-containing protein n=1 Tax=Candidatus Palauibacter sp. TaxID=3101350 RepID=UPI003B01504E
MRRHLALSGVCLLVLAGCEDARPHAALMADAAADVEAIRLEQAMVRFDSARATAPDDAEAHRQFATLANYFSLNAEAADAWERALELDPEYAAGWEGYIGALRWAGIFETDRRYGEKILRVLPEALRHAPDRPVIYDDGEEAASDLGQLDAYAAILAEQEATRPDDQILLHALASLRIALADREGSDRGRIVRDSLGAVLDALAAEAEDDPNVAAPVLYRLAAGYDFRLLRREDDADRWLERLEAAPDRGDLADDLRYWDLAIDWQEALYSDGGAGGDSGDGEGDRWDEVSRLVAEGLKSKQLGERAAWSARRYATVRAEVMASLDPGPSSSEVDYPRVAAEPPGPTLDPDVAESLFTAVMEEIRWQDGVYGSRLATLLYFGIQPEVVLEKAVAMEAALRADRPGYLYAGSRGQERETSRKSFIDQARVIQARALTQLGEIEAAGALLEELATESRRSWTLAEYARHLLRENRLPEALDAFVEATAFRGWYRPAAVETAEAIGLSEEAVEERLAVRGPAVERELEQRELGQRIEREAPEFALADQTGVEWRLDDLEGKIVVLKFWATWCGPCIEEFPHFVELLDTYEGDDEVVFLTVATAGSPRERVAEQIEEGGFTFPVLFDEQGLALDYEILAYPTTLYLDRAGFIQFKREGFYEDDYEEGVARRIDALRGDALQTDQAN